MPTDLFAHLHLAAPAVALDQPGVVAIDVACDQEPLCDLRPGPIPTPRFAAVTWTTTPDVIGDRGWRVVRQVVWDHDDPPGSAVPPGALKQTSLVRRRTGQSREEFGEFYIGHGLVARDHHGMSRYAQNIVVEAIYGVESPGDDIDGISELWFASRRDWSERFYLSADSPAAVREDTTRFIDFKTTSSAMMRV